MFSVDLSSETTAEAGLTEIGVKAGLPEPSAEATLAWLTHRKRNWLLLLDNADDPDLNVGLFYPTRCNHGNIIVTTRNPDCKRHALGGGIEFEVQDMERSDATNLLLLSSSKGNDLDSTELQSVEALLTEFGCLALPIVQAGAYISNHNSSFEEYLQLFKQHRSTLMRELSTLQQTENYHRSVYATWELSVQKLRPISREFLQLCAFMHHEGIAEEIFERASRDERFSSSWGDATDELHSDNEEVVDFARCLLFLFSTIFHRLNFFA